MPLVCLADIVQRASWTIRLFVVGAVTGTVSASAWFIMAATWSTWCHWQSAARILGDTPRMMGDTLDARTVACDEARAVMDAFIGAFIISCFFIILPPCHVRCCRTPGEDVFTEEEGGELMPDGFC